MEDQAKKVLVIDVDEFLVRIYVSKLQRAGFQAVFAVTSQDAEEMIATEMPDAILLEPMLEGGLDGFDFVSQLKSAPNPPALIILSNLSQPEDINRGLDQGADAYLIKKQITFDQVIEKIKDLTK